MTRGDKFSAQFIIDDSIYHGFISIFKDNNPLHTDENFAKSKGFAGKVMHGNILNGFLSYFIGELLPEKNVIIHSQSIEYKNPVFLNDEIDFESKILEIYDSVGAIEFSFTFRNRGNGKLNAKGKIQIGLI
jgi:3-hydroxybutyryl-CoA dehydratase